MSIWQMTWREIVYRKGNFLLGLVGVVGAVGILIGILTNLEIHTARSEQMVAEKARATAAARVAIANDVRHAMQHLGYNAIILPKDQSLGDWYADDYAAKTMPADTAARLDTTAKLVDRYLPQLRRKINWTEKKWTILIVGLGREKILDTSISDAAPLADTVAPGTCIIGHELQAALKLHTGQTITILGREFQVAAVKKELGTKDDITIWLDLADAQKLLELTGQINEIMIVEHVSVWGNLVAMREHVASTLPDCQVIEIESETMSRAHARVKVAEEARDTLAQEREKRAQLRGERLRVLTRIVPIGALVCAVWIGLLVYSNVRDRRQETGALMAIGFPTRAVRTLYLTKALLLGTIGGVLGYLIGGGIALLLEARSNALPDLSMFVTIEFLIIAAVAGAAMCLLGSWLPVRAAVALDPADVLHDE